MRTIKDGESRTATSTFTQFLSSVVLLVQVQCCFTSTETVWTFREGEPRMASSTFLQLLSFGLGLSPDLELSPELSKYEQR